MWKDYSAGYIKHNRASSVTVMAAAFISALLLSLLCSLFYNFWIYEIERLGAEEGGHMAGADRRGNRYKTAGVDTKFRQCKNGVCQ